MERAVAKNNLHGGLVQEESQKNSKSEFNNVNENFIHLLKHRQKKLKR